MASYGAAQEILVRPTETSFDKIGGIRTESGGRGASITHALVVDLDGTLIKSDLLVESLFAYLGRYPWRIFSVLWWLLQGRSALKHHIAEAVDIDVTTLPFNRSVVDRIAAARNDGRHVYLASASNERYVRAVAEHLNFEGWFASSAQTNLSGRAKAFTLVEAFGRKGYDYIGDARADLPVWEQARTALMVAGSASLRAELEAKHDCIEIIKPDAAKAPFKTWFRLLRPHQWAKNALVVVPLLTAHAFSPAAIACAAMAFVAFSLCASSVYVVNDLVDIQADRGHPTKCRRPFASGRVPILTGALLAPVLLAASIGLAAGVSLRFLLILLAYYVITTGYTFLLKRKMMIDVVTLACLYTLRVIGGAVAISVPLSEWLLAFSMFIFLSLALIKRHSEMAARLDAGLPDPSNRDYRVTDLPILISLASSAGYAAVVVMAFYISSPAVAILYRRPYVLWLILPLLLYWISRVVMLSHRRLMHDDPIVFALKDRISLAIVGLVGLVGIAAL